MEATQLQTIEKSHSYVYLALVCLYSLLLITGDSNCKQRKEAIKVDDDLFNKEFLEVDAGTTDETYVSTRGKETPCNAVLTIIAVGGLNLLQENLYLRTNPTNIRPILDVPQFTIHTSIPYAPERTWSPRVDLFFNETRRSLYTKESPFISSYIALADPNLIQKLDDFEFDTFDIPLVLSLFENIKLEDRRAGFMFDILRTRNRWTFEAKIPLIYEIRNFFLNNEEQKAIERSALFDNNEDMAIDFARHHLITDRIGLGDSRINIGYTFVNDDYMWCNGGLQLTLPTAGVFTIIKGLYGTHFNKNAPPFRLDLIELFNFAKPGTDCYDPKKALELGTAFLEAALDRLSAILLEQGLGNGRHIGLGIFGEYHMVVSPHLTFRNQAFLEYQTPAWEPRFYLFKKNVDAFIKIEDNFDPDNPALCAQQLDFIENQLTNTFFPSMFTTRIAPGVVLNYSGALSGTAGRNWRCTLGYNLWLQSGEKRTAINAPDIVISQLQLDITKKPTGYQNKFFAVVDYEKSAELFDWCCTGYIDYTFLNTGIGKDVNIVLGLKVTV
jgi:hypothetical protein